MQTREILIREYLTQKKQAGTGTNQNTGLKREVKTGEANKEQVKKITKAGKHKGRKLSDRNERKGDHYKIKQEIKHE